MPIAAGTWLGGNCSISSWACCLSAAITRLFYTATLKHPFPGEIHRSQVTSNLAAHVKQADYGQGGGGVDKYRDSGPKSSVVKILTSKLFDIKILQTLFANTVSVKAFRE